MKKLNSYKRIMTAMELKEPDRIPILEVIIDPKVYKSILPEAKSQTDFEEYFELDAVCCGAYFANTWQDGKYFKDEWGVLYKQGPEQVSHPVKGHIEKMSDLKRYNPPSPDLAHRLGKLPELVKKFKNKKAIIFHQRAAFMWSAYLAGIDNLLADFLLEPEFANELLDTVLEVNIPIARKAVKAGADIILLGDDYAANNGPLFSPAVFREFIMPRLKKMVEAIHEEGGKVIKHSDGNLWQIIDKIIETGIDGLNPIEPAAGMDIGEVKKKYGDKVCLIGNIDCSELLPNGSREDVIEAVRECIFNAGKNGGFILSSSNSIHSSVKPENYLTMIEAAKEYGNYPISN
jgi:uroporphyrinogen decarboxylase